MEIETPTRFMALILLWPRCGLWNDEDDTAPRREYEPAQRECLLTDAGGNDGRWRASAAPFKPRGEFGGRR
jgi:hypothetical protein